MLRDEHGKCACPWPGGRSPGNVSLSGGEALAVCLMLCPLLSCQLWGRGVPLLASCRMTDDEGSGTRSALSGEV